MSYCTCGDTDCGYCGPQMGYNVPNTELAVVRAARDLVGIYNKLPDDVVGNLPAVLIMAIKRLDDISG